MSRYIYFDNGTKVFRLNKDVLQYQRRIKEYE